MITTAECNLSQSTIDAASRNGLQAFLVTVKFADAPNWSWVRFGRDIDAATASARRAIAEETLESGALLSIEQIF